MKVNCAALPPTLVESELFGHEKGAFTGAMAQRKGRFELADGATLFLDEVGELTPELQAKLLRVLQDGDVRAGRRRPDAQGRRAGHRRDEPGPLARRGRRAGSGRTSGTGSNVFPISVPPLRQRKEDIPTLALAFVARASERLGRPPAEVPQSVILALQGRDWPGNVRELQNIIEQAVLVSDGGHLRLPDHQPSEEPAQAANGPRSLEEVERRHILEMLEAAGWKLEGSSGAAALLGLKPSTLRSRMQKLDIRRPS